MPAPPRIGIIGAGRLGTALARRAIMMGYDVRIATARAPAELAAVLDFMAPGAIAGTVESVARDSDIIVLALPLSRYHTLRPELFAGKIVVDAMNYWPETDGRIEAFEAKAASSQVVQRHLPQARLVRALNHAGPQDLDDQILPAGHTERQALAVAGDDFAARTAVAAFIERLGFDPVDAGPLAAARKFDVGTPVFGGRFRREELLRLLDRGPAT